MKIYYDQEVDAACLRLSGEIPKIFRFSIAFQL